MAFAPGISLGPLILIPEASRSTTWQLNGGASSTFVNAWGAGVPNPYTPKGVKGLWLQYLIQFTGDGADVESLFLLRKNGSAVTDGIALTRCGAYLTNLGNTLTLRNSGYVVVECDSNGIIEYINNTAATVTGALYLVTHGYFMGG